MKNNYRDFDDYVDEISIVTVGEYIKEKLCTMLNTISYPADHIEYCGWDFDWKDFLEDVRIDLTEIEECLNNTKEEYYEYCGGKVLDQEAIDLRNQIVNLKKQYSDYINSRKL